jgi:hypothetical protein
VIVGEPRSKAAKAAKVGTVLGEAVRALLTGTTSTLEG